MNPSEPVYGRLVAALDNTFRRLGGELVPRLKEIGLTMPQFHLLKIITMEGSCRVTRLADMLEVKPSAITVMIERLVHNGLAERGFDDNDRRAVLVSITEDGRAKMRQVQQQALEVTSRMFSQLEPEELHTLAALFEKIGVMPVKPGESGCRNELK